MQVILRLYSPADADLIALKLKYGSRFPGMIRSCIESFLTGERYVLRVPDNIRKYARETDAPLLVNLNLGADDKIGLYIASIKTRARTDVIKTLVRSCYDVFPAFLFFPESDGMEIRFIKKEPPASVPSLSRKTNVTAETLKTKTYTEPASPPEMSVVKQDKPDPILTSDIDNEDSVSSSETNEFVDPVKNEDSASNTQMQENETSFVQEEEKHSSTVEKNLETSPSQSDQTAVTGESTGFNWVDIIAQMNNHI